MQLGRTSSVSCLAELIRDKHEVVKLMSWRSCENSAAAVASARRILADLTAASACFRTMWPLHTACTVAAVVSILWRAAFLPANMLVECNMGEQLCQQWSQRLVPKCSSTESCGVEYLAWMCTIPRYCMQKRWRAIQPRAIRCMHTDAACLSRNLIRQSCCTWHTARLQTQAAHAPRPCNDLPHEAQATQ